LDVRQRRVVLTEVLRQSIGPNVGKYKSTPHNIPEEWRSHLQRCGSLKSLTKPGSLHRFIVIQIY